jgi:predicted Zn-dependent protease
VSAIHRTPVLLALLLCFAGGSVVPAQTGIAADFSQLSASADEARNSGRLDEAAALYRKAVALRPAWAEGWWYLGTLLYDRNEYREAAQAFQKVAVLDSKAGTARVMLGLCEFALGDDDNALRHIQEGNEVGIAEDPQLHQVILYHEAVLLQRKGKFEGARQRLHSLCLRNAQGDELIQTLGMLALRMRDRHTPAKGTAEAEIVARVGHAECLAGQKKFEEARRDYRAVVEQNPSYPNIHYAYGRFLLEARDLTGGVNELQREIKNNPKDTIARLEIAAAWYKVDSAAGLPYAEEAVKLDPGSPLGHYLLGILLLDTDDYLGAIPELEIAQKAFAREAKIYLALGAAYSRAGRDQEAARARAEFQRLDRDSQKDSELPTSP